MKTRLFAAALAVAIFSAVVVPHVLAVSSTTMYIMLYLDKQEAVINDRIVALDTPATIVDGKTFVPAKFLGDTMGFKVAWNDSTKKIEMETQSAVIELDPGNNSAVINGVMMPFDSVAKIVNGRLMVKLTWVADYMGAKYKYNEELRRVEIIYVKQPKGVALNSSDNSKPVAKFTFGKPSYRIGEPVKYIDLSYDPDAEGIVKYEWTGNHEAFFTPGKYPVTLKVTDSKGNVSNPYTRYIEIKDEPYLTELEYKLYYKPPGTIIKTDWSMLWEHFWDLPQLPKTVTEDKSRTLLVSDSPETFTQKGILYQDKVKGKARLYADHVNGMEEKVQFVILATNNSNKEVTVKTTNKGEVYPSIYANIIGHEASVDFLLNDPVDEKLVIPPGQSRVYVQMPEFLPGQGVNVFYDVDTGDDEVTFSFIAMDLIATPVSTYFYKPLPYEGHVRGTFPVSEVRWAVDASSFTAPSRLIIGDGTTDPFVKGYDVFRNEQVKNEGNYGVVYKIHAANPRKMVVLLLARGGNFKGPVKINGEFVMVPPSGVLTAFDGLQILARTKGTEKSLDIEFTPPAGSAFPVDLIFYPLKDLEE